MRYQEFTIEGKNAVIEAYRSGKPIDKIFILDGANEGPIMTIKREAKKHDTMVKYVSKERLDQMSETGKHQGVIAYAAAYEYAEVEDMLELAKEKGEPPFLVLLDGIEEILLNEKANVEATIPLVQLDSRLGWEPSMEYIGDARHLRWKIKQVTQVIEWELTAYENLLKKQLEDCKDYRKCKVKGG